MKRLEIGLCCLFCLFTELSFADGNTNNLYCPQGAQYIQPGMNILDVKQACGAPIHVTKREVADSHKIPLIQWTFRVGSLSGIRRSNFYFRTASINNPTLVVTFKQNKVMTVSLDGQGMPASDICGGIPINKGDDMSAVSNACGTPNYTNETYTLAPTGSNSKEEIWSMKLGPYQPDIILTFKNGILQSIAK
jgi:hypothetical protein